MQLRLGLAIIAPITLVLSFSLTLFTLDYLDKQGGIQNNETDAANRPAPQLNTPKERDARRKADLQIVQKALDAYAAANKTYVLKGAGGNGTGQGFINHLYTETSIIRALHDSGFLVPSDVDDPITTKRPNYMLFLCDDGRKYSLSATLEVPSKDDLSNIQSTCNALGPNGTFSEYHKNYAVGH